VSTAEDPQQPPVEPNRAPAHGFAGLEVTNTGDCAGAEVVQLYVGARSSKVERAPKELKAFSKVELEPGETHTVHLAVPAADLPYCDEADGWTVEPGEYEVIVGRHSLDDQALSTSLAIQ
jgi:beta-glucosidase